MYMPYYSNINPQLANSGPKIYEEGSQSKSLNRLWDGYVGSPGGTSTLLGKANSLHRLTKQL